MYTITSSPRVPFIYRLSVIVLTVVYLVTGIGNIIPFGHIATDMSKLGYPAYLLPFLGVCKLLAAGALILPVSATLKQCAFFGVVLDLTGAIYSRMASGDTAVTIAIPFLLLMIAAVSWSSFLKRRSNTENIPKTDNREERP